MLWKKAFEEVLDISNVSREFRNPITYKHEYTPELNHEILRMTQNWSKKGDSILQLDGSSIVDALHLDNLLISSKQMKLTSKNRIVSMILFAKWKDLKLLNLTELRGIKLIQIPGNSINTIRFDT